jgi:hypothetical protein
MQSSRIESRRKGTRPMSKPKRKKRKEPILELAEKVLDLYDCVIELQKNTFQSWKKIIALEQRLQRLESCTTRKS